jgi:hypothetical protein
MGRQGHLRTPNASRRVRGSIEYLSLISGYRPLLIVVAR